MGEVLHSPAEQRISGPKAAIMARRYQSGSLRLVGKRKKQWKARFREDIQLPDGAIVRPMRNVVIGSHKDFSTKRLAQRELDKKLAEINSVTYRPKVVSTFAQFCSKWKESVMVTHKPSAQAAEKTHISLYLEPRWGKLAMRDIEAEPEAVQAWVSGLPVSPKYARNIVATARLMFKKARAWGYVTVNPFKDDLEMPEIGLRDEPALTLEQIRSVITASPEPYKTMFWILGETGIRAGELLALRIRDVDLDNGVISVRQSLWQKQIQTVKSKKGNRTFAISSMLVRQITAHIFARTSEHALLFVNRSNEPFNQDNVRNRHLYPILEKLEIPQCGFHAFRHGNATLMSKMDVPDKVRMDRLGHEKFDTTLGYTHALGEDHRIAAEKLGELIAVGGIQ